MPTIPKYRGWYLPNMAECWPSPLRYCTCQDDGGHVKRGFAKWLELRWGFLCNGIQRSCWSCLAHGINLKMYSSFRFSTNRSVVVDLQRLMYVCAYTVGTECSQSWPLLLFEMRIKTYRHSKMTLRTTCSCFNSRELCFHCKKNSSKLTFWNYSAHRVYNK